MARRTWSEFTWPDWVPAIVREQIESFWSASASRGPDEWEENSRDPYNHAAPFGARVEGRLVCSVDEFVIGRYVHAWNNIGRLVDDRGGVHVVSGWRPVAEPVPVVPADGFAAGELVRDIEDESHQHAILTPAQLGELVDEAKLVRDAIDEDRANPVAVRLLATANHERRHDAPSVARRDAYLELGKRLDVYALALLHVTANGTRFA